VDAAIEQAEQVGEFVHLFNSQEYFEAHEVLEDLWVIEVEPFKSYYKGLIQVAVALCHWHRGNVSGALKLWNSGTAYVAPFPAVVDGLRSGDLIDGLAPCFERLKMDQRSEFPAKDSLPKLVLEP